MNNNEPRREVSHLISYGGLNTEKLAPKVRILFLVLPET
jgi:hypothetical protein